MLSCRADLFKAIKPIAEGDKVNVSQKVYDGQTDAWKELYDKSFGVVTKITGDKALVHWTSSDPFLANLTNQWHLSNLRKI